MPNTKSAQKRIRQTEAIRSRNIWRLRAMRTAIKDFNELILHGTVDKATTSYQSCQKIIDRTASHGVIHKNQAARRKARLSAKLKAKKAASAK